MLKKTEIWFGVLFLTVVICVVFGCKNLEAQDRKRDAPQFFPIGLYSVNSPSPYSNDVTEEFPEIAAAGFNVIQSYQFEGDSDGPANTIEDARAYLDAAYKSGLKVLMGIPQECVIKGNLAYIRERVLALKDHPAIFGWQLYDEPDVPGYDLHGEKQAPPLPPRNLIDAYETIKQIDPTKLVSIASFLEIDEKYPYLNGFDIFLGDYMNIPIESPAACIEPYVSAAVRVLTPKDKSVMPTIQVYNVAKDALITSSGKTEDGREIMSQGRYPTHAEIRFMAYYAILRGAKGVFFNCYRFDYGEEVPGDDISPKANPKQWQAVSSVASELKSISQILLAPQSQVQATTAPDNSEVEFLLKDYQETLYLIAVNSKDERRTIAFTFSEPPTAVKALNESRTIFPQENSFTDDFAGYGVHVYEIQR